MGPAFSSQLAASIAQLCGLIAHHGLRRGLAGPLIILIWQRIRTAGVQVEAILARLRAGALRTHPNRRRSHKTTAARRPPRTLPGKRGWLVDLMQETAGSASQLQRLLDDPEIPALLAAAPQLRRRLRPLCHMLGVRLPPLPPSPPPPLPPPAAAPLPAAAPSRPARSGPKPSGSAPRRQRRERPRHGNPAAGAAPPATSRAPPRAAPAPQNRV